MGVNEIMGEIRCLGAADMGVLCGKGDACLGEFLFESDGINFIGTIIRREILPVSPAKRPIPVQ
jgi:hypothetical protein